MNLINILDKSKDFKTCVHSLNQQKPIQANQEIRAIHRFGLTMIGTHTVGTQKKSSQLLSPFSLFSKKTEAINPSNISLSKPSPLNDKISALCQPTQIESPLQNFVKLLSSATEIEDISAPLETSTTQFSAEIIEIIQQRDDFITIRMKPPADWQFFPGQYLEIRSENSTSDWPAILAVASGVNDEYIEITARPSADPSDPNYCLNGSIGEKLIITGPQGSNFPVDLITSETQTIILGGGSGITALKSLMESLPEGTNSKLIYSNKTADGLLYPQEIEKWKQEGHTISLTRDKAEGFKEGRVTEHLREIEIKTNTLIFICGPEDLVLETAQLLADMGIPRESIYGSLQVLAEDGGPVFRGDHSMMMV